MRCASMAVGLALLPIGAVCQEPANPAFDVASIRLSARTVGKDYGNLLTSHATGLTGRNVTLRHLILAAYHLRPYQVAPSPGWIDSVEYDLEARVDAPVPADRMRLMLQRLLSERFRLVVHRESKPLRVYELVTGANGPSVRRVEDESRAPNESKERRPPQSLHHFRGSMQEFADLLGLQLTIQVPDDPARPGFASGGPVPVIDKTGLPGLYEIELQVKLEAGVDMLGLWQRTLESQLGLKLVSRRSAVEVLAVDGADRIPAAN